MRTILIVGRVLKGDPKSRTFRSVHDHIELNKVNWVYLDKRHKSEYPDCDGWCCDHIGIYGPH